MSHTTTPTTALAIVVVAGCACVSYRLARAIRRMDDDADVDALIAEAEAIVRRAAYGQHPSTWPHGGAK